MLGIDGGGSRTAAVVGSGSSAIARASAGPSNVRTCGPDAAVAVLESVVTDVLGRAEADREAISAVAAGLAGISRRQEREPIEAWLRRSFPARPTTLVSDVELVLVGGVGAGAGVAVVSGTGSIVLGRTAAGRTARSGGWGPAVGDPGSGYAIGRAGLLATAEALDGIGPRGRMSELILERTGAAFSDELGAGQDTREIAALVRIVCQAAEGGDPVAAQILETAGEDLARQVATVLRRLHWDGGVRLALAGGVLVHVAGVRDALLREVAAAGWILRTPRVVELPVDAAMALASKLLQGDHSAP